jgi:hypothetical protein
MSHRRWLLQALRERGQDELVAVAEARLAALRGYR